MAAADILGEIARRDVVLLGEQHDAADHHRWQLQTLAALYVLRPRMAIGFEFFPRGAQPVLDRWVAGELTLRQFLDQSEWDRVANVDPQLYAPLFEFARLNRISMIALNVERKLINLVAERGFDAVPRGSARASPARRRRFPPIANSCSRSSVSMAAAARRASRKWTARPRAVSSSHSRNGTWLPLKLRRGDETIELIVRFPAEP